MAGSRRSAPACSTVRRRHPAGRPAVLLAYPVGGAVVFMVMRALGEMAVHQPSAPARSATTPATNLGPLAGFLTGWTYTFEMVIVALADVTAFGIYMGLWFPEVAQWVWVLSIILFIGALNPCSVKVFGELEFWLSLVKVAAIVAMIVGGAAVMLFGFRPNPARLPVSVTCGSTAALCLTASAAWSRHWRW
ncbi:hypothetical protein M8494_23525 [Serratia ureilytica]